MRKRLMILSLLPVVSVPILAGPSAAQDIELKTWAAPRHWSPVVAPREPSEGALPQKSLRIGPEAVVAATVTPLPFVAITPCRLIDTRSSTAPPFPSGYGPPSMPGAHVQRSFTITSQCLIPVDAQAVSFNFTVWAPVTRGDIRVFPAGLATPAVATLNWEANIQAQANAAVVALGTGGAITVQVDGPGTIDLIVDVNGYYSPPGAYAHLFSMGVIGADGTTQTIWTNLGTWTSSRNSTGSYGITFPGLRPQCGGSWPTLTVTANFNGLVYTFGGVTNCISGDVTIPINTLSTAGVAADGPFTFSAFSGSPAMGLLAPAVEGRIPSTCTLDVSTGRETCE